MPEGNVPHDAASEELFHEYHRSREPRLRDELVTRHLPLARAMARRYAGRGVPADDREQVAVIGLIKAIDRFDPSRGIAFSSFAVPTILGELRRHFRDHGWTVRTPRRLQELRRRCDRARSDLAQRHGRHPSLAEVAAEVGVAEDDVLVALDGIRSCFRPESLQDQPGLQLADPNGPSVAEQAATAVLVHGLLDLLPPREREIVAWRFGEGLTQQEIATRIGISQMHVSRLLRRSLDAMRNELVPPESARPTART